jgi:purine-binding chemotaxis protein CheW
LSWGEIIKNFKLFKVGEMGTSLHLVVFILDGQQYGVQLSSVKRILRIVEITPLPKAPEIVSGVINLQGRIIPVMNMRKRFGLPEREINLSDHLVIAETSMQTVALLVDEVDGIIETNKKRVTEPKEILPALDYIAGVVKLEDGMILIHDLDKFLSLDEEKALDDAVMQAER